MGVVTGQACSASGSACASLRMSSIALAHSSSVSRDSVSVGSSISASWTMRGKYIVGGWMPRSIIALATSSALTPVSCLSFSSVKTNSCMQMPGTAAS